MADEQEAKKAKTRSIGSLPPEKIKKIEGWSAYVATASALTKAREASEDAKDKIREALRPVAVAALRAQKKVLEGDIDFTVEKDGTVKIFENLQTKGRTKSTDLSEFFS
jgi:glutathionylspermidine synthase